MEGSPSWFMAHAWKACRAAKSSRVRIPPLPPSADKVHFYYVYILWCNDGKPYIGCTNDLKDRIKRHNKRNIPATKLRLPVKLIAYFVFSNKYTAFNFKKYLKSGSGRAFIKNIL